jgi:DNA (cytosine-5)-methyltransferase 1
MVKCKNNYFMSDFSEKTVKTKVVLNDLFSTNIEKGKVGDKKFTFIDLFAGIGGIRIGFESVGGDCVFTSEWDTAAQKTYQANFNEIPYGDITKITPEEIPSFDMLLAGFPCQPFSQAGLKKGFEDTRGTLFFDIARIVEHHKPSVVFLENVRNLASHDKGNTLKVILATLEDLGYKVFFKILNAKEFGVPQNRARVYIIGFRDDVDFVFPEPPMIKTKVWDILDKKVDDKYTISDRLWAGHQRRKKEHLSKGNGFGYSIFDENSEYTSTISARYYKDGSEILIKQENKNPRKLTPKEASRLQGFPEDFIIPVSDVQAYKQFGNSVAVPVIKSLAKQILETLEKIPNNNFNNK